ncbi:MAG TPA: methyltransferase, partial [Candidatus Obscuribacterales bacterium]
MNALMAATTHSLVAENFSRFADSYDNYAQIQRLGLPLIVRQLHQLAPALVAGPVLEIGCGTGFLSIHLLSLLQDRKIVLTDISAEMLSQCSKQIVRHFGAVDADVTLEILDASRLSERNKFALITSSFSLQWLPDCGDAIERQYEALVPGGTIALSFPCAGSFAEWQDAAQRANCPFTGNALPDPLVVEAKLRALGAKPAVIRQPLTVTFSSAFEFFRSIKRCGAGTSMRGSSCTLMEFRHLCRELEDRTTGAVSMT